MTENILNRLLFAIDKDDLETARQLLNRNIDLNVPCSEIQEAPPLFLAILKGNPAMVKLLLDHGADPNFQAAEPASYIYADNPLSLARGARLVTNWDLYHQIVLLLRESGAIDDAPQAPDEFEKIKAEAKRFQSQK